MAAARPVVAIGQPASQPKLDTTPAPREHAAWARYLPWLLVLTLVPLVWPGESGKSLEQSVKDTIATVRYKNAVYYLADYKNELMSLESIFAALPGQKCLGAFLPRSTSLHWAIAAGAVALFGLFFLMANVDRAASPRALGKAALISALAAVAFLVLVGLLTERDWHWWRRMSSYSLLLVPLSSCFDFSFHGAIFPENGLVWSFLGFTLVAGLCEELLKAIPVLLDYRRPRQRYWRGALLLGLASGAAFGIVEAALYSREFYNGVSGPGTYLIAFLTSIALQAVWTGSAALAIHRHRARLENARSLIERGVHVMSFLFVPLMLHGLYDTLLKMHWTTAALVVAAASFVYLGLLVRGARRAEGALRPAI
jgi:RsiW-degrading membrane proteinase PrsW (M82 family)